MKRPSARRSYDQFCGLARALDVIGERWTMLILRNLLLGPRRYSQLLSELPGITTNLLAKRLRELCAEGLVERGAGGQGVAAYRLTESGHALEPALLALATWGGRYLDRPRPEDRFDIGWALLSMKRRYRGSAAMRVELVVDDRTFSIALDGETAWVREQEATAPDLRVIASLEGAVELLFLHRDPERLLGRGKIAIEGRKGDLERLVEAFPPSASPARFERADEGEGPRAATPPRRTRRRPAAGTRGRRP